MVAVWRRPHGLPMSSRATLPPQHHALHRVYFTSLHQAASIRIGPPHPIKGTVGRKELRASQPTQAEAQMMAMLQQVKNVGDIGGSTYLSVDGVR